VCWPGFSSDSLCLCEEGSNDTCTDCPAGFEGPQCSLCPASNLNQNKQVVSVCNGHGACSDVNASPHCTCSAEYTGVGCDSCVGGYAEVLSSRTLELACDGCVGMRNPDNYGAFSGGQAMVSCYYRGNCSSTSDQSATVCDECVSGWGGTNCCEWSDAPPVRVLVITVTLTILILLYLLLTLGGPLSKIILLMFAPTVQVRTGKHG
jgi:hypothetical protein